ncbi:MAG: tetratricopeptide repeat protein [candidate division Zixibacteria bacterium]|nr:tetratricopeptide repeat protein [candidate division Zixibacteria bacterium]
MKRHLIFALFLLILAGCSTSPEKKAESLFNEAVTLTQQYQFEAAESKFTELGELDSLSPASYFGSGLILEKKLQYYDALQVYLSIVKADPSFTHAQAGCWRIFTHFEKYKDALEYGLAYDKAQPKESISKLIVAESFMDNNMSRRARVYLDSALTLGSNPYLVSAMRARSFALDNKLDSAEQAYEKALKGASESSEIAMETTRYLEEIGLIDSAIVMSNRAVKLDNNNYGTMMAHFELALRHNYFYEARRIIKQFKSNEVPELVTTTMDMFYTYAAKEYTPSRHAVTLVGRLSESSLSYRMYEMLVHGAVGDELTVTHDFDVLTGLMEKQDNGSKFQEYLIYFAAMQQAEITDDMIGISSLEKVSSHFIERAPYKTKKAYLFYRTGQSEKFGEIEKKILKYHSQPNWLIRLADIYANRFVRRYDDAEKLYRKILETNQWHKPALKKLVAMHRRLGNTNKAAALFDDYPHFPQHFPEFTLLQAVCLVENNQIDKGVKLFLTKAGKITGDLSWFRQLREALIEHDRQDKIIEAANWFGENAGQNPDALTLAASILGDEKQYEAAQKLAEQALDIEQDNLDALAYKARSLYYLGKPDAAIEILNNNASVNDRHITSNYFLSRFLSMEGINSHRASNLARRAVFDSNSALKEWVNLCYVYFQVGRYDLSRGEAGKASRSYKGEPEPMFRLGMALYMEGKEEAAEKLQEAIDLGLRGDNLLEAKRTLKKL